MRGRKLWIVGIVALALISVVACFGLRQYQQMKRLAAFQALIREGSGQAESILGALSSEDSIPPGKIQPECEKSVQERRELIEKVAASDMSNVAELQTEYIALLTAENDLIMKIGAAQNDVVYEASRIEQESVEEECSLARMTMEDNAKVRDKANNVLALEQKFKEACARHGLTCEPTFAKYGKFMSDSFEAREMPYHCR